MSLPQSTEYDEAIQNSRSAFVDPELRSATNDGPIFMGVQGGPVASGNFAIVYRFRTGSRRLGVKCFTREKTDQQARYQLIHEHLAARKLPWTIDFTYIKEGIRVKGKTYPIVKMEWIENAKTLLSHINDAISANQPLNSLCDQFYRMAYDLKKHSIAHGDLQHANLIISDGTLRLIDYDGMCVPKIVGFPSEEDGLPDYQHPRRHGGKLQSTLDHFSTLVIWTSLYALTIDPTLWRRWVREDERLLFSKADFTRPDNSALIRELLSFRDPRMSSAVEAIVASAATSLEQVPHLAEVVRDVGSFDATPWWQSVASPSTELFGSSGNIELKGLPAWITSTKASSLPPVQFRGNTHILCFYSVLSIGVALIVGLLGIGGVVAIPLAFSCVVITLGACGMVLYSAYLTRPETALRSKAATELSVALDQDQKASALLLSKQAPFLKIITDHEQKIVESESKVKALEVAIEAIKKRSADRLRSSANDIAEKRNRSEKAERDALSNLHTKKASAKVEHESNLREIEQELKSAETRFTTQVNLLSIQANRDREAKFAVKFDAYIQGEMQKIRMMMPFGSLDNFLGHAYGGYLRHKDGRLHKIYGIGPVKGAGLDAWRKRKIEEIRLKIPSAEREAINRVVEIEMQIERQRLETTRNQARTKAANTKAHEKAQYERTLTDVLKAESEAKQRARLIAESLSAESTTFKTKVSAEEATESLPLTRELWTLESVVNPARHLIRSQKAKMYSETLEVSRQAAKAREKLDAAREEAMRYVSITYAGFVSHVFS